MPTSVIGGLGATERLATFLDVCMYVCMYVCVCHAGHYEGLRGAEQISACG